MIPGQAAYGAFLFPLGNVWGNFAKDGTPIQHNVSETSVQNEKKEKKKYFVINDITTYFTLLVGIYFPSVTGKRFTLS